MKAGDQTVKYYFRRANIFMVQSICMEVQSICTVMKVEYLRMATLYELSWQSITIQNCDVLYAIIFLKVCRFLGILRKHSDRNVENSLSKNYIDI